MGTKRAEFSEELANSPNKKSKMEKEAATNVFQCENMVGITEYISKFPGFSGILKHRFSDFLVNEIDLDGNIIKINNFNNVEDVIAIEEDLNILEEDDMIKLKKLDLEESSEKIKITVTQFSKDERRKIHEYIRKNFSTLDSLTENNDTDKLIIVQKKCNAGNKRKNSIWPHSRGNFTHFALYKENKDTMDALNLISKFLRMKPSSFSYSGTKDKRGKTTQMCSVYRVTSQKLLDLNNRLLGMKIGNIAYKDKPLKLGDLKGNHFTILLRDVKGTSPDLIKESMESLKLNGFINYYGMQRFGTTSVSTQDVGRCLLANKWKEAIELILKPRQSPEDPSFQACRKVWWETRNADEALRKLNKKHSIEGCLLKGLIQCKPNDKVNALNMIPRNSRLMYIHSYQSYIWNKVVSLRLQKYGCVPVVGDLFLKRKDVKDLDENVEENGVKEEPEVVTEKHISEKLVSPFDIVLPLPGVSIKYPENEVKEWYLDILKEDNMSMENFKSKVKTYCLGGSYRHVLTLPENLSWSFLTYSDPDKDLLWSDIEEPIADNSTTDNGPYLALKMEFSLPSSCYATMVVREIMKNDTSTHAQKTSSLQHVI